MSNDTIITVENLSKRYRLGQIGATSLRESAERFIHRLRGRDVNHAMGEVDKEQSLPSQRRGAKLTKPKAWGHVNAKHNVGYAKGEYGNNTDATCNDLNDSDGSLWALRDVSFEVKRGEVLGIIGRNGAGKSTLLKILTRITEPTSGRAIMRGRVASLLEVGTGFHPELTGRENIFLNGAILGMTKQEIKSKFDEIVAFAEVEKFIDTPVKRYSSGMYVRLAFAVAAHLEPEILLVDEVLAVGDAQFQKKCLGKMQDVAKHGRTVLFVSHNMAAVQSLCSSAIMLNQGGLIKSGHSSDVIQEYLGLSCDEVRKKQWSRENAPGNQFVRLLSAEVRNEMRGDSAFRQGDAITLEFKFEHLMNNPAVYDVTFHLWDEMNIFVFYGASGRDDQDHIVRSKGIYIAKCDIPSGLLHQGEYTIKRLLYVKNRGTVVCEFEDVLYFKLLEKEETGYGWKGGKFGVIKPVLNWEVKLPGEEVHIDI